MFHIPSRNVQWSSIMYGSVHHLFQKPPRNRRTKELVLQEFPCSRNAPSARSSSLKCSTGTLRTCSTSIGCVARSTEEGRGFPGRPAAQGGRASCAGSRSHPHLHPCAALGHQGTTRASECPTMCCSTQPCGMASQRASGRKPPVSKPLVVVQLEVPRAC